MISFLVTAYNEEKYIKATVDTIYKSVKNVEFIEKFEIIIVNDGSDDLTEKNIQELKSDFKNITYCKNEKNLGIGASIKKGLKQVKYAKFMLLPGDNDVSINAITSALKQIHVTDLVMPFPINTEDRTKFRNITSKLYSLIYITFFDCCVNYINGPSIFPTEKVRNFKLHSNRNGIISEIITKLLHSDITYCEVPVFFGFQQKERAVITIKVLYDVIASFIRLFIEMKVFDKKKFSIRSKRKNIY